jgi:hypothetical protein
VSELGNDRVRGERRVYQTDLQGNCFRLWLLSVFRVHDSCKHASVDPSPESESCPALYCLSRSEQHLVAHVHLAEQMFRLTLAVDVAGLPGCDL